jgi:RHS repeat-associated protein
VNSVQELSGSTVTANLLGGPWVDEVFTRTDSAGVRNFLLDGLGSTEALTDSSSVIQTQYTYGPFGSTTSSGSSSTNEIEFAGRENDGTGLYYYRARYYSPSMKRFIGEDPLGFGGGDVNYYSYALNDPASYTDPLGLTTFQGGATFSLTLPVGALPLAPSFSVFAGVASDSDGNYGIYYGWGAGTGYGAGWSLTADAHSSDGKGIADLAGPFMNVSGGGGWGEYGVADGFYGPSDHGAVHGLGGGYGAGAGASGSLMGTVTTVVPLSLRIISDAAMDFVFNHPLTGRQCGSHRLVRHF